MRIKSNAAISAYAAITADELGMKPTRAGWGVREKQAQRFARLLEAEERPTTRKAKAGKQAITGRVRVERAHVEVEEVEMEFSKDATVDAGEVYMLDDRTEIPLGHWFSYDCFCSQCARMRAETVV